ncbi:MAG TPA: MBL fold metallo-hydrolase [Candidatus Methylacidiphilales bacterium]|nr:MBL fold metallo-hydrolase [Candidatus Methylacidiphilales bacterium]
MLRFTILGSGSSGNCAYLETEHVRLLIDAGFSAKQIGQRLGAIGRSIGDVQAIFLTHEHGDHVCGLPVLAKRHHIPVYCNRLTAECLQPQLPGYAAWQLFESGGTLNFGDLRVNSFSVPHDAYDPVGFMFYHALGNIGFLTDLGYATKLVLERVRAARALVLEANHDLRLLQEDTKRPWAVKQRILSRHGHLSNDAAAEVAAEVATDTMEAIYLGHLSADCNRPEWARAVVSKKLTEKGRPFVQLRDTAPDQPCETLVWS